MWKFLLHQTLAESQNMMTFFEAVLRGKVESLILKMDPFHFPHKAPSTKHKADMMLDCSSEELFLLIDLWFCFELEKKMKKTWPCTLTSLTINLPPVLFGDYCRVLAVLSQLNAMSSGSPIMFATQFLAKCQYVPAVQRRMIESMEANSSKGHGQVTIWMKEITSR